MSALPRLWLTTEEAVQVSGVSRRSIQYAISSGALPSTFHVGRRRIRSQDLESWMNGGSKVLPTPLKFGRALPTSDEGDDAGLRRFVRA